MEQATTNVPNDGVNLPRVKFAEALNTYKAIPVIAEQSVVEKVKRTATATDDYVQGNPWAAVSIAASVGIMLGFLAAKW